MHYSKTKKPALMAGFPVDQGIYLRVLLGGLEPSFLAPEANALSTELQEREADFTINYARINSGDLELRIPIHSQVVSTKISLSFAIHAFTKIAREASSFLYRSMMAELEPSLPNLLNCSFL